MTWEMKIPVISTSHLQQATVEALPGQTSFRVADFAEGMFVWVGPEDDADTFPEWPDLQACAEWFRREYPGEYVIRFDADGDVIEELETFDW